MPIDRYLSTCTELKPMWKKDLNLKPDTLSLTEETMGDGLTFIGLLNSNMKISLIPKKLR